jgi:ABC-type nitrate/sulfonate/bicarbonate transport system permease component
VSEAGPISAARRVWLRPALGLGTLALLLIVWELATRLHLVSSFYFPPFSEVVVTLGQQLTGGSLGQDTAITLIRTVVGYAIAVAVGIGAGLLMGASRRVAGLFQPTVELMRPLPMPALIPVAMLLLGIGDSMKITMIAVSALWPILINTVDGVVGVDPQLVEAARSMRAGRARLVREVLLPAAAPQIAAGMRVAMPIALIVGLVSEMIGASNGLGYFIVYAQRSFAFRNMFAGIVLLALVGFALNRAFLTAEQRVLEWHYRRTARTEVL